MRVVVGTRGSKLALTQTQWVIDQLRKYHPEVEFEVKIIKIDTELKRISLSLKRMGENPWQQIEGQFEEGQIVKGTVNKVTTFGAFINIFPGVEALLPVSEMSDENVNPFNMFKVGSEVDVLIKKFTPKEHRIALSVKDIQK